MMKRFLLPIQNFTSLRFAFFPLVTSLFGNFLFEVLAVDFPQLNKYIPLAMNSESIATTVLLNELKARLLWLSSVLLYSFITVCFFYFLWQTLKRISLTERLTLIIPAIILSAIEISYLSMVDVSHSPLNYMFRFTFDSLSAANLFTENSLSVIYFILGSINLITILTVFFCIAAGCSISTMQLNDIANVNKQFQLLNDLIKGASATMIAGIIHMQLWLNWPLSLSHEIPYIIELKEIISSIILFWGVCFSLTIASLYLPIATYLRNKANTLADKNILQDQQTGILFQSTSAQISQIVTILGPLLVSTLVPALSDILSV